MVAEMRKIKGYNLTAHKKCTKLSRAGIKYGIRTEYVSETVIVEYDDLENFQAHPISAFVDNSSGMIVSHFVT